MAPPHAEELTATPSSSAVNDKQPLFKVNSPAVEYTDTHITSKYVYSNTVVNKLPDGTMVAEPTEQTFYFKTERAVPRVG